jgi:hypothetical protein
VGAAVVRRFAHVVDVVHLRCVGRLLGSRDADPLVTKWEAVKLWCLAVFVPMLALAVLVLVGYVLWLGITGDGLWLVLWLVGTFLTVLSARLCWHRGRGTTYGNTGWNPSMWLIAGMLVVGLGLAVAGLALHPQL